MRITEFVKVLPLKFENKCMCLKKQQRCFSFNPLKNENRIYPLVAPLYLVLSC